MKLFYYLVIIAEFVIFLLFCTGTAATHTLVVYDDVSLLQSHSQLLQYLKTISGKVTMLPAQQCTALSAYDENSFDNVIVLNTLSHDHFKLSLSAFTSYLDRGGNLVLLMDTNAPSKLRLLANELGYGVYPTGSLLQSVSSVIAVDGIEAAVLDSQVSVVNVSSVVNVESLRGLYLLYSGNALVSSVSNRMTLNVVTAPETSFLYEKLASAPLSNQHKGSPLVLVGAVQMLNKHRALLVPSLHMFSDKFLAFIMSSSNDGSQHQSTANGLLLKELLLWTMQEKSVLRVTGAEHVLVSSGQSHRPYSVMQKIRYSVTIEEKTPFGWKPFVMDSADHNQLIFSLQRIVTHIRVPYNSSSHGNYSVEFHIPDYIGLYKCQTNLERLGYTPLDHFEQIAVRPRRHDQFPRFVVKCWPFYATTFLMLAMTAVLSLVLINSNDEKQKLE